MDISLKGKYAVVCGSTQGIGLATAGVLADLGANCILIARNKDTLGKRLPDCPLLGRRITGVRLRILPILIRFAK